MIEILTYNLPFKKPFVSSQKSYAHREGIIIRYSDSEITAYGEVAPLPGFSNESLESCLKVIQANKEVIQEAIRNESFDDIQRILSGIHSFPSLDFGLDTLFHDVQAKRAGMSLFDLLKNKYEFHQNKSSKLSANATISISDQSQLIEQADQYIRHGFKTLKVKVGVDFEKELAGLKKLRSTYNDIKIRIDANQSWLVDEAVQNLKKLESLTIEYCEQPIVQENLTGLANIRSQTTIPIAADESVRDLKALNKIIELDAADIIILKPGLFGSYKNFIETKHLLDTHNIKLIITSALESNIARSAIIQIAALIGEQTMAQGVSTGTLFEHDLSPNLWRDKADVELPKDLKGIGMIPLSEHLTKQL